MQTRDAYRFDPITREYLGIQQAYPNIRREGEYLLPENCTFYAPPEYGEFEIPVFDGTSEWTIVPDYRKKDGIEGKPFYCDADWWWAEAQYMETYGDIPEGCSFDRYEKPQDVLDVIDLQKQYDALVEVLQSTDYYARRIYEYEQGSDSDPEKEAHYRSELQRLAQERKKLAPWETQIEDLKTDIAAEYGEEALNHLE